MSDVNVVQARSAFALVARPSYFCSFQSCITTSAWPGPLQARVRRHRVIPARGFAQGLSKSMAPSLEAPLPGHSPACAP